ncbi:MAG: ABC transporter ATP-binding protein [Candidatus Latescibacteria bacterium]|jgi:ABC-type multidrug transport system fused ATPase/permease subunit|nr:ABC transporter ATP-binding protein [Candidatus Latescibacterota bacterium]
MSTSNEEKQTTIRRMFSYLIPFWKGVTLAMVSMLAVAWMNLIPPWLTKVIIDDVFAQRDWGMLHTIALVLIASYIVKYVAMYWQHQISHVVSEKVVLRIRTQLYEHLQSMSMRFFRERQTGEIMSRVVNDTEALRDMIAHTANIFVTQTLTFIGIGVILFAIHPMLACLTLLPVPIMLFLTFRFNGRIRTINVRIRAQLASINARLQDNISGIPVIQLFAREREEARTFKGENSEYLDAVVHGVTLWSRYGPLMQNMTGIGVVTVAWYGGFLVMEGTLSVGSLVAFMTYLWRLYWPITEVTNENERLQKALAAADRIFEYLDETPEIQDAPGARVLEPARGQVAFESVRFSYHSGDEVISGIDLEVQPGEVMAIVGHSGAGKTTLTSLIVRAMDPTQGRVLIDGCDLRDIRLESLRRSIGIVAQETFLFNASIRDNIAYARPEAETAEVIEAARAANILDLIEGLPQGLDTVVGERGMRLSGGEKQRIAIARALLKDPPILILDEATSSVDTESERLIQESLGRLLVGRTTFIIAHRLATVRYADRIVVLKDGQIAESGTHDQLLMDAGLYHRLHTAQIS